MIDKLLPTRPFPMDKIVVGRSDQVVCRRTKRAVTILAMHNQPDKYGRTVVGSINYGAYSQVVCRYSNGREKSDGVGDDFVFKDYLVVSDLVDRFNFAHWEEPLIDLRYDSRLLRMGRSCTLDLRTNFVYHLAVPEPNHSLANHLLESNLNDRTVYTAHYEIEDYVAASRTFVIDFLTAELQVLSTKTKSVDAWKGLLVSELKIKKKMVDFGAPDVQTLNRLVVRAVSDRMTDFDRATYDVPW